MKNARSSNANTSANAKERSGLSRGLDVLELLADRQAGMGLGEIARQLDMSKSGVHGVLSTLTRRGFAERETGGVYRLGIKSWLIGRGVPNADLARVATPLMERLVREIGEGAILGVLTGFEVVYVSRVEGSEAVRVHANVNDRIPAHCTSTGLALLAYQPDGYLDAVLPARLKAVTPTTITTSDDLRRELKRTRARGYAINLGGWRDDVGGIAAPVLNEHGLAIAGLCVAVPRYRMTKAWFNRIVPATKRAAEDISRHFCPRGRAAS